MSALSRLGIRWKLTGAAVLLSAVALGLIALAVLASFRGQLARAVDSDLNERTTELTQLLNRRAPAALRSGAAEDILRPHGAIAQVINSSGTVVGSSATAPTLALPHDHERETVAIPTLGSRSRVHVSPLVAGRRLVIARSLGDQDRADGSLGRALFIAAPLALLLVGAGAYLIAGRALRPVEEMAERAASISLLAEGGALSVSPANDELAALGRTLNELLDRVAEAARHERALVANASHELRTPLARIRARLELALTQPPTHEATAAALRDVRHLASLADDLLVLAAIDEGGSSLATQPVDLLEIVDEIAADARTWATDRAITVHGDPVVLEGNARALRRAIGNLVDNAIKHGAGTIEIGVSATATDVVISVGDDGPGLDVPLAEAVERFSRGPVAQNRPGAGLGLALVGAVAQAHHGDLTYADRTFTLSMPLARLRAPVRTREHR